MLADIQFRMFTVDIIKLNGQSQAYCNSFVALQPKSSLGNITVEVSIPYT